LGLTVTGHAEVIRRRTDTTRALRFVTITTTHDDIHKRERELYCHRVYSFTESNLSQVMT